MIIDIAYLFTPNILRRYDKLTPNTSEFLARFSKSAIDLVGEVRVSIENERSCVSVGPHVLPQEPIVDIASRQHCGFE